MASTNTPVCDFGWPAPDFALRGVDGRTHSLASASGPKGLVVMFICNHCPYVKAVIQRIVRDCRELASHGVGSIAIMSNDTVAYPQDGFDAMSAWSHDLGFPFPYVIDETQAAARAYDAQCTPDFFGFNASLELQYRGRLDASRKEAAPEDARRELFEAMLQITRSGEGPAEQIASIGCSIKWKEIGKESGREAGPGSPMPDLSRVRALESIVREVAREIVIPRHLKAVREHKSDGSSMTEADLAAQHALIERLPDLLVAPVIGEEMTAEQQIECWQAGSEGVWCIDPIDGTTNFTNGIPMFAISVAYLVGGETQFGVVYNPITDESFYASRGAGAWLNGMRLPQRQPALRLRDAIAGIDFKHIPKGLASKLVAEPPYYSQRNFGSSALEWCFVAAGRLDVYLHGGQALWDYAAGQLIAAEAGGDFGALGGGPLIPDPIQKRAVVLAASARLFDEWLAWLQQPR